MASDILTLLQEKAHKFSKGQRAISRYILESYDKAAFMTAGALGKAVGVSESTVVRFAVELGFDGYPAMQKALQETAVNRLSAAQRIGAASERHGATDMLSSIILSDMEMLRKTDELADRQAFSAAVEAILEARKVYVVGTCGSAPVASYLGYYLELLLDNVLVITHSEPNAVFERLVSADRRDVVIAISFPRHSTATGQAAEYCRGKGVRVIGITDSSLSPLGRSSSHVLLTKSERISVVDSLTAPMSMANALIAALASRRDGVWKARLDALESLWGRYHVYEK